MNIETIKSVYFVGAEMCIRDSYIHNRYASQQQQIEIDRLKKELTDIKYDALTRSSELMAVSYTHLIRLA